MVDKLLRAIDKLLDIFFFSWIDEDFEWVPLIVFFAGIGLGVACFVDLVIL